VKYEEYLPENDWMMKMNYKAISSFIRFYQYIQQSLAESTEDCHYDNENEDENIHLSEYRQILDKRYAG
jgi:hypothetical protein